MREALHIDLEGVRLQGTRHTGPAILKRGVLFFNFGYQPRSARGDLAAQLADSCSAQGYSCFRFDLPGLGDSEGELPTDVLEFYQFVQSGGYTDSGARLAEALRTKFGLADVVLLGLCGGAMTAVFSGAKLGPPAIAGLALLDPQFYLNEAVRPKNKPPTTFRGKTSARLKALYTKTHDRLLETRWEPLLTAVYGRALRVMKTATRHRLPSNANNMLIETLVGLLQQNVPVLAVTAHPPSALPPGFDYLGYIHKRTHVKMQHVKIEGTTHSFVENGGREALQKALAAWLATLSDPHENSSPQPS